MKRISLPLLGSNTVIQADRIQSFTCVMRCHTRPPKGKSQNILSSNSVAVVYIQSSRLDNPNVHQLLNPVHLPTPDLPKRLSLIFLWAEFSRRAPISIVNTLLYTVCTIGGRWGAQYYLASPENNTKIDCFLDRIL